MAVDLRDTNIDPARPEYRKMLENLQSNILKPHGRKESNHLVLRFAAGPETIRGWIREFARREVTSAQKQLEETGTYHDHGTRGGLVASLALSAAGYRALGLLPEDFGDPGRAFRGGMKRRSFSLLARNRDPSAPLGLVLVDDPFTSEEDCFGSYLVFRKLQQDVENFNAGVKDLATRLGADEALAGALVVGRFKDGTPVTLRPWDGLGAVNNFEYLAHDRVGNRCPFHAHIRKANQRGANPVLNPEEERTHRIVRRGIPYGVRPAPPGGASADPAAAGEVGLLFQAFQGDIARQFGFIQRKWVDSPNFPEPLLFPGLKTGADPLIGQHPRAAQRWPRTWGRSGRFLDRLRFNFGDYVRLRGGEYFFTPSLSFLKNL